MVIWGPQALADVARIARYIAEDNPFAASRLARSLAQAGESLIAMPRRGRPGREAGTRELVIVRPYVLVYEITAAGSVTILRIWHAAQDRPEGTA